MNLYGTSKNFLGTDTADFRKCMVGLAHQQQKKGKKMKPVILDVEGKVVPKGDKKNRRFTRVWDGGIFTVPHYYHHQNGFADFRMANPNPLFRENKLSIHDDLNDDLIEPSYILRSGVRLHVTVFSQVAQRTTLEKRLEFLDEQGAVYPGARIFPLIYHHLPKFRSYDSIDRKGHLTIGCDGYPLVATLRCGDRSGNFVFGFEECNGVWGPDDTFNLLLCFREIK